MFGDLRRTRDGRIVTEAPTHCPVGHRLGPQQVIVGHQACRGHGGGHFVWFCRACDEVTYGPPLGQDCTILHGAGMRPSSETQAAHPYDPPPPEL